MSRRFSYAEILDILETAREKDYRNDADRAEQMAATMERCLYLALRNLGNGERAQEEKK